MPKVAETKILINLVTKVPASILMALNAKLGDTLEWHIDNGDIKIKKATIQQKKK